MNDAKQLNLKGARVYDAVSELSELTGESMTAAVLAAVEERVERVKRLRGRGSVATKLMEHGRRYSALPERDTRTADEIIGYDENGLPT